MQPKHQHFSNIDSTNSYAKRQIETFSSHQTSLITADEQSAGRGRFSRQWISPSQGNFYGTFVFFRGLDFLQAGHIRHLPLLLATTTVTLLHEQGIRAVIKWPNDLLLNERKFGGILCESTLTSKGLAIILGMGINLNMEAKALAGIDQPATSIKEESGSQWNLQAFTQTLFTAFEKDLLYFFEESFAPFFDTFERYSLPFLCGRELTVRDGQELWKGHFDSLNPDGSLSIRLKDGTLKTAYAGEI